MTNGGWPGHVIKGYENACRGADFACDMQVRFDSSGGDRLETSEKKNDRKRRINPAFGQNFGRSEGTRTPGILLPKQARYQLRYTPIG